MAKTLLFFCLLCSSAVLSFSQSKFSDETKKYITYNDSVTVLRDGLLIDGKGNAPLAHQSIVIANGKIDWVGEDAKLVIPKNALVIMLSGKAIMPGLVMLHEHMYISGISFDPLNLNLKQVAVSFPRLYLAAGATTIRTCGSIEPFSDLRIKKDIDDGISPGPSIDLTAPYLEGRHAIFSQMNELKGPDDAVRFVDFWADQGFTSFKAYTGIDKPTLQAAIDAVHKRHLKITGHLCSVTYQEAARMGIDHLEHGFFASTDFVNDKKENSCPDNDQQALANLRVESDSVKNLIRFLVDKKIGITSTLAVIEGFTTTQPAPSSELLNMFSPDNRDFYLRLYARLKSAKGPRDIDKVFINNAKMEKMFSDMGGLLTAGTDPTGNGGTIAGYGTWRAIELLVEADGFTPIQAIKIATLNGAIALGREKSIGTVEVGKSADLLIVDGDPSKNISDIRKVQIVFRAGIGYDSKRLIDSMRGKVGFF